MTLRSPHAVKARMGELVWTSSARSKDSKFRSGIKVVEANRATEWCRSQEDVAILERILLNNYRAKGVNAVLVALEKRTKDKFRYEYAVFVESGFLKEIPKDE